MDNITINIVEASSEIADLFVDRVCDCQPINQINDDGTVTYTEEAQDLFNQYYDEIYEILNNISIK